MQPIYRPMTQPTSAPATSTEELESKFNWALAEVIIGVLISVIAGTYGMSVTVDLANTIENGWILAIVSVLSFLTIVSINAKQLAMMLEEKVPEWRQNKWWHIDRFLTYFADWQMTFAGGTGFTMLIWLFSHSASEDPVGWWLRVFGAVMLGVVAYLTAYGVEEKVIDMLRYRNILAKRPEKAGFEETRLWSYRISGYLGMIVSAIASAAGSYLLIDVAKATSEFDLPTPVQVIISILIGVFVQVSEMGALKKRQLTTSRKVALGFLWFADTGTVFAGIGGITLIYWIIGGPLELTHETIAMGYVAAFSKLFMSYNAAVSAELTLRSAEKIHFTVIRKKAQEAESTTRQKELDASRQALLTANSEEVFTPNLHVVPVGTMTTKPSRVSGLLIVFNAGKPYGWCTEQEKPAFRPASSLGRPAPKPMTEPTYHPVGLTAKPEPTYHSLGFDSDDKNHPKG